MAGFGERRDRALAQEASAAPIIVTALMGAADFGWAEGLRRAHFPPGRNRVPAHVTLFHHLPPSALDEVARRFKALCAGPPPAARLAEGLLLGRGLAYRVDSTALAAFRDELAGAFAGRLVTQDQVQTRFQPMVPNTTTGND